MLQGVEILTVNFLTEGIICGKYILYYARANGFCKASGHFQTMSHVVFTKILKIACFPQLEALHVSGLLANVLTVTETIDKWNCFCYWHMGMSAV